MSEPQVQFHRHTSSAELVPIEEVAMKVNDKYEQTSIV